MERKHHGSHWFILLTRLFLSCCIVWQQRNHTRQGEGGAETTQRDYCSSDQTRGSQVTRVYHATRQFNTDLLAGYANVTISCPGFSHQAVQALKTWKQANQMCVNQLFWIFWRNKLQRREDGMLVFTWKKFQVSEEHLKVDRILQNDDKQTASDIQVNMT